MITIESLREEPGEVSFVVARDGREPYPVWVRAAEGTLALTGEALCAATLVPAMATGNDLELPLPVSERTRRGAAEVGDILKGWYPTLNAVAVRSPGETRVRRSRRQGRRPRVAAFFTAGVDSFYSVLKHRDRLDLLVLVQGFDVGLDEVDLRRTVGRQVAEAAAELGIPFLEVETNLREFTDAHGTYWGTQAHGAALATIGHLLADVDEVLIAASFPWADLYPWASHPLLDPRWSSDRLTITHDGCEKDRVEKIAVLAEDEVAMAHLRVCFVNEDGAYNCGRCMKCQRTMAALARVGALERCTALPHTLDLELLRTGTTERMDTLVILTELVRHVRESGPPELVAVFDEALARVDLGAVSWPDSWLKFLPEIARGPASGG